MNMTKQTLGNEKYAHYSTLLLVEVYTNGPNRLRNCIKDLTASELKAKPIPEKWSIAEIIIHLADAEIIGSCRFRQAYTSHPGPFPYYDQAIWAENMRYQAQSIEFINLNLEMFDLLRKTTANLFAGFSEADWAKTGLHPERGEMTVRGLLELYADHSERHIEQILERRTLLGKRSPIELILKDRLY
jgi:uncharacterized damage-inducible protein DinB